MGWRKQSQLQKPLLSLHQLMRLSRPFHRIFSPVCSNLATLIPSQVFYFTMLLEGLFSTDLSDGPVTTLQGESVTVDISESGVKINESNVTAVDIAASNGVVHKIDSVLLPPVAGLGSCAP